MEELIAEFLADVSRTSLELPHMTTGQRKEIKTIVAKYPELVCESFGFGQDRQLHVFKSKGAECSEAATADSPAPQRGDSYTSTDQSTTASPSVTRDSSESLAGMRAPPGLEVRNTFIHFPTECIDERVIQSMPHGMFRESLLAEARAKSKQAQVEVAVPLAPPPAPVAEEGPYALAIGGRVLIDGLLKSPGFNGLTATVESFDEGLGRYNVIFDFPIGGHTSAKVKRENLLPIATKSPTNW